MLAEREPETWPLPPLAAACATVSCSDGPEYASKYYRARYYDPKLGRFISEDPIGFLGGVNFYSYVEDNPANLIDPFGLESGATARSMWCMETGRCNSRSPNEIYDDAMKRARNSGLPGPHNGPQDAFRHCLASCMMTRELGESSAATYGWANEKAGDLTHGQESGERRMDDTNNACGRRQGRTSTSTSDCENRCTQSLIKGDLTRSYTQGTTQPYRPY